MNAIKSAVQLEDLRRRELMELAIDGPMVRRRIEGGVLLYGHLPTKESLATSTPLGHYKTKIVDMGLCPYEVMQEVERRMEREANSFAFHDRNERPIGSRMYHSVKEVVAGMIGSKKGQLRIYMDTFIF